MIYVCVTVAKEASEAFCWQHDLIENKLKRLGKQKLTKTSFQNFDVKVHSLCWILSMVVSLKFVNIWSPETYNTFILHTFPREYKQVVFKLDSYQKLIDIFWAGKQNSILVS